MTSLTLVWIRRDLRLSDHAALVAAVERRGPVIPVFVRDGAVDALGAAPKWRLGLGVGHFAEVLQDKGSRLILRSGDAREVIPALAKEVDAGAVYWQRAYDPDAVERDTDVKAALKDLGDRGQELCRAPDVRTLDCRDRAGDLLQGLYAFLENGAGSVGRGTFVGAIVFARARRLARERGAGGLVAWGPR